MERIGKVATWLELAVAPEWRRKTMQVCVHPVGTGKEQCFAISMDGRRLCASNGQLTTFRGRSAVERFLHMVQIDTFDLAEPDPTMSAFPRGYFCMCLNRQNSLGPCSEHADVDEASCSPSCNAGQVEWIPSNAATTDMHGRRRVHHT